MGAENESVRACNYGLEQTLPSRSICKPKYAKSATENTLLAEPKGSQVTVIPIATAITITEHNAMKNRPRVSSPALVTRVRRPRLDITDYTKHVIRSPPPGRSRGASCEPTTSHTEATLRLHWPYIDATLTRQGDHEGGGGHCAQKHGHPIELHSHYGGDDKCLVAQLARQNHEECGEEAVELRPGDLGSEASRHARWRRNACLESK